MRADSRPIRNRSCTACAKAKVRCDNKLPSCTRCTERKVDCVFQATSPSSSKKKKSNIAKEKSQAGVTSVSTIPTHSDGNLDGTEAVSTDLELDLTSFGEIDVDWQGTDIDFSELDDQSLELVTKHLPPLPFDQWNAPIKHPVSLQLSYQTPFKTPSIPTMPIYSLRSFLQRPSTKDRGQTTTTLMLHILTSYPSMMKSPDTLPPFIHPYSLSSGPGHGMEEKSAEALTTCMSLIQMLHSNVSGSRKLLWKNVRLECDRMSEEVHFPLPTSPFINKD